MRPITELDLITARAPFIGDISGEKVTLVLCHYGKQAVSAQGSGLLPRRCLHRHVTRQPGSSGDYGGCISKRQGATYLLFPHTGFSFTFSLVWEESLNAFFLIETPRLQSPSWTRQARLSLLSWNLSHDAALMCEKYTDVDAPSTEYSHLLFN